MKRLIALMAILIIFTSSPGGLFGQENNAGIAEEEIQGASVQFQNRNNLLAPQARREREYNLGKTLAEEVSSRGEASGGGVSIRRVFSPEAEGFGADILSIQPSADYGHINGINRIMAGYLSANFEYAPEDALIIGRVIIDYNGRNRQNANLLRKYSVEVSRNVNKNKLGIAIVYNEWPGKTEILIPLRKNLVRPGQTDLIAPEVTRDTDVSQEDKTQLKEIGKERRQEDLKRLDKKDQELRAEQKELRQEKEDLKQEKEAVESRLKETDKVIQEFRKDPTKTKELAKEEARKEQLEKKKEELTQKIEKVSGEEEQVTRQRQEVAEQKKQTLREEAEAGGDGDLAAAASGTADQPDMERLKRENEQLKSKIEEQEKKSPNVVENKILFLRVLKYIEGGHYNNELWQIDPINDDALRRGPYTNICGREFSALEGAGVVVIGHDGDHADENHHLILLDPESLEFAKSSRENIFWRTSLIIKDDMVYAFEVYKNLYYLSRFKKDMSLDARSSVAVNPDSDITFFNEKIYVTGKKNDGASTTIQVLSRKDLSAIKTIDPGNYN